MKVDALTLHVDDILQDVVGDFHGTPIREYDTLNAEIREISDAQQRVRYFLGSPNTEISVLPGEVIKDNLIRRETAAEVRGDEFYVAEVPKGRKVSISEATDENLVTWRPMNLNFAVVHGE